MECNTLLVFLAILGLLDGLASVTMQQTCSIHYELVTQRSLKTVMSAH